MLSARDGVREVEAQLSKYVEKLHQRLPVAAIVVTGSRARNDHFTDSDIDLLVVSNRFEGMNRGERILLLLQDWFDTPALEPLGYTRSEVLRPHGIYLWDALMDGRVWQDDGSWREAVAAFRISLDGKKIERTRGGWRVNSGEPLNAG